MKKSKHDERAEGQLLLLSGIIAKIDAELVSLLARRMEIAEDVAQFKMKCGSPILREKVERQRTKKMVELAREAGLDPEFVRAVAYLVIAESCRVQLRTKESGE